MEGKGQREDLVQGFSWSSRSFLKKATALDMDVVTGDLVQKSALFSFGGVEHERLECLSGRAAWRCASMDHSW